MTRSEILKRANEIINGERQDRYGNAENNFDLIGDLWSAYLGKDIIATDVAHMMTLFKIARAKTGVGDADSYIDACGYMACGGEIATKDEKPTNCYLEKAPAGMHSKYVKLLKTQIDKQTNDKRKIPDCCCAPTAEDIAKIAKDNEYKRKLLDAIFHYDPEEEEYDED